MSKKVKQYYQMSKEQYDLMKEFYTKLGFDKKLVKKLCKNCFGAEVRKKENCPFSDDWTFYRRIDHSADMCEDGAAESVRCGMAAPMPLMRSAVPMQSDAMTGMMNMASASTMPGMMGMSMADASAMPGVPMPATEMPEFNTAETHDAPENEEHSPLDQSQVIFSANVNTASWDYMRSRIMRGKRIDKSFVRVEEIINSYRYYLDKPEKGELFSVAAEGGKCPWKEGYELLFIGLKGKKATKSCKQNLSLLIDVSGSMDDEWILTQMAVAAIVSKLKKGDLLSIIAYSDDTVTVAKQLDGGDMEKCVEAILDIDGIGGCTNGSEGLTNAYKYLAEHYDDEANNRVFIFTDGDFNFGITSEGGLKGFIEEKKKTGIYLSIVGFGERNFKDNKMETLARNGNGNYTFVSNPYDILDNLWEKLVSNLVTVAKDVKISVEFNPAYVSEYRLIGYDARMLTQEEFHDTEKAVDGIGSEHNVVALIEYKKGKAEQKYKSRYVKAVAEANEDELAFVEIHYKSPEGENLVMTKSISREDLELEQSNLYLAGLLAGFGLLVKDSEYKGSLDKKLLSELLEQAMESEGVEKPEPYSHFDVIKNYINDD